MNVTSVKRAFALAATTVGTGGAMMLVPTVANAATAHPTHVRTVSNVSRTSDGPFDGLSSFGGCHDFCNPCHEFWKPCEEFWHPCHEFWKPWEVVKITKITIFKKSPFL